MNDAFSTGRFATRTSLFVLAALVFLAPTAFWVGGLDSFESIKSLLLHGGAILLLLIAAVAPRRAVPRDPVSLAVLLLVAACALATATSIDPLRSLIGAYQSYAGLLSTLALAAVYFAARVSADSPSRVRLLLAVLGAAAATVSGYGLIQAAGADPLQWALRSDFAGWVRPISTLGHPMHLGGFLAAALPIVLWLAGPGERPGRRAWFVPVAAAAVLLVLTLARGAWLGALAGLFVLAMLRGRTHVRGLLLAGLLLGLAAVAMPAARERLSGLFASAERVETWRACWALFLERPLTGHGPESLSLVYGRHLTPALWEAEWGKIPAQAHNEFLNLLVTQGVCGGFAGLALIAGLARAVARAWRSEAHRPLVAALAASLAACVVQLMTGFGTVGCLVPFAICCGVLARLAAGPLESDEEPAYWVSWPGWRPCLAAGLACAVGWVVVGRPARAWWLCAYGVGGQSAAALSLFDEAVALCPERDEVWLAQAAAAERLADRADDQQARVRLLRRAVAAGRAAVAAAPRHPENHAVLGRGLLVLARAGDGTLDDVLRPLERAMELSPRHAIYLIDAARACLTLGDAARAEHYLDRAEQTGMRHGAITTERGGIRLTQRRYREARLLLTEGLAGPWYDDVDGMNRGRGMFGLLCLETGKPAWAVAHADEMVKQRPEWPMAHWIRARGLELLGRKAEAEAAYRSVLERRPDHPQAREALARLRS